MKDTWHNNRISKKINEDYPKDFSLCDIDGIVRCHYEDKTRFIIYESKNENEKPMGKAQLLSLKTLEENINWSNFDKFSGVYVLKIIDLENMIIWYNLKGEIVYRTTFEELYKIFSCKIK